MFNLIKTHNEVILPERYPVRANDQRIYLCFNCQLYKVDRLNLDYIVSYRDNGGSLFGNLTLLVKF